MSHDTHSAQPQTFFAADEAKEHLVEDQEAWNGVVKLLLFIVTVGVCLMTATVLIGR